MDFKEYKLELGSRILKARRNKGLTQREVAKAIGHSQSSITQIESGKVLPRTDTLFKLSKALDTPVNKFFPEVVPNGMLGFSFLGMLWVRFRYGWYRRKRKNSGSVQL